MKKTAKSLMIFGVTSAILFILLLIICLIPNNYMENNVRNSSRIIKCETWDKYIGHVRADNYTEELMINMCYSVDKNHPMESAILSRRNYVPGVTTIVKNDSSHELDLATDYMGKGDEETEVEAMLDKKDIYSFLYTRYWHGYICVIRPLLVIFDIKNIRLIIHIVLMLLAAIMLVLLYKKTNFKVVIIYILSLLSVDYLIMGYSLQGAFCFIIRIDIKYSFTCTKENRKR